MFRAGIVEREHFMVEKDKAGHYSQIKVYPRGTALGAEIKGVDFSQPIDIATANEIDDALMNHQVIYFKGADIEPEQLVALGRAFGELSVHPFTTNHDSLPEIMVLDNHKDNPVFSTDIWHSDETFREEPPMGTILRCIRSPEIGGDTLWTNMCAVYESLSDKLKSFLSGLEAIHDFRNFRHKFDALPIRERHDKLAEMEEKLPNPTHPLIRTHPITGQKILYVNEQFTIAIKGMKKKESQDLLDMLFSHVKVPEFQFRHKWEPNDMIFWDNRSTQHYAVNDYYPNRRTMHRVTIKGDKPF